MNDHAQTPIESLDARVDLLNLAGWSILDSREDDHGYQIIAEVTHPVTSCPACLTSTLPYRFGAREHTFVDLPIHGKYVQILARLRRYRCRECHKTFLDVAPQVSSHHHTTMRLVNYVERESLSLSSRTFLSLGRELGVPEDTVRHIFDSCVRSLEQARTLRTPTILGIDEIHLLGAPRCILTDIGGKTVIDLLPNRTQETVIKWLRQLPSKERIEAVTMDMWQPFRNSVREVLPQARIIVDHFHAVKMANEALERVRKETRAALSDTQRRRLMRDRYLLLKRKRDLTDKDQFILETWTENFPALGKAYAMKEGFFEIWNAKTVDEANDLYYAWLCQITPEISDAFVPISLTMEEWGDEIFNYWEYDGKVSNAFTEAKNGALKAVNRAGRGYSLPVIRAKVIFAEEIARKYPRPRKPFQPAREMGKE